MSIMKFDTLSAAKELQGYGFEQRQAEGVVETLKKTIESSGENLATKGDLEKVEITLSGKIDTLRAEMTSLKWILGVLTAAVFSLVVKAFIFA
ncbi:MAG: CCDC90 family protein [Helicobacteraceae bacterium]|jgi:hypothetical protein|nr:CCDC90 family protein [Helicobacteraceae bacterium]